MTVKQLKEIPVIFYRSSLGAEPVRDWLRNLPSEDRRTIGFDLATVQVGWPVGMPLCHSLGGGLWEVRSTLPSRRIARMLFFIYEGQLIVLHGFIKQTQRTPQDELELARKRMKEVVT
ncbi:MAG: type II toxin-antitoxin system RelE/ParE family toxin [Nitrospirae bacterium]|nr:type II toxin-antitoxin system RelE/ParE family toxin [Nitrospirota bacterium]MBF0534175.1 type II toxin-antitoxin system RelE/ParE family toxin [Nitrospirota bacterium]MBF0617062.1 type II toxin-antitoxin system RelE/ParE family toxin [Nitrospirota bacterium]